MHILFIICIIIPYIFAQEWTWNGGSTVVNSLATFESPGGLVNGILLHNSNNLYYFGGYGFPVNTNGPTYSSDLWRYDTTALSWTRVKVTGPAPLGRCGSVGWIDVNNIIHIFGGEIQASSYTNDLWSFNITSSTWTYIGGSQTSNTPFSGYPDTRSMAVSWYSTSRDTFYLYGGISSAGPYGDLWQYEQGAWSQISGTVGVTVTFDQLFDPGNRVGAAGWIYGDTLFIFGGMSYNGFSKGYVDDLWSYSIADDRWLLVNGVKTMNATSVYGSQSKFDGANIPGSRWGAASLVDKSGFLWLFGGQGYNDTSFGYLNDLWVFNGSQWAWIAGSSQLNAVGIYGRDNKTNVPGARRGVVGWINSDDNPVIFGGYGYANSTELIGHLNDVWTYDRTSFTNSIIPPKPVTIVNLRVGQVVGIVVGVFAAALVISGILFWGILKLRGRKKDKVPKNHTLKEVKIPDMIDPIVAKNSTSVLPDKIFANFIIPSTALTNSVVIGEGSFGVVERAELDGTEVAVKRLRSDRVTEKDLKAFQEEASIMRKITAHPNIVMFRGVILDPPCIVTDFCNEGSLYKKIHSSEEISMETKFKWILEIVRGMIHLHTRPMGKLGEVIIHRDLATRNILLKNGSALISDFGLSRLKNQDDSSEQTRYDFGPLKWMAPECFLNREYSQKSDVFSFGVVVYEIVARKIPWEGLTPVEATHRVAVGERMDIPAGCPPVLAKIMEECWQQDPKMRPEFKEVLEWLLDERKSEDVIYDPEDSNDYGISPHEEDAKEHPAPTSPRREYERSPVIDDRTDV